MEDQDSAAVLEKKFEDMINYGPESYCKAGSPAFLFAEGPTHSDNELLRGHCGKIKYHHNQPTTEALRQ